MSAGGSGYFTFTQICKKKKVTREFKSGGLNERHVVATWKFGNHEWENIKENIKTSAKASLGLHERKQHKPWFDQGCI